MKKSKFFRSIMRVLEVLLAVFVVVSIIFTTYYFYNMKQSETTLILGDDIRFEPESLKIFFGSWVRIKPKSPYEEGFSLYPEGVAESINSATLLVKKWKIEGNALILSVLSLGNHSASASNDKYIIKAINYKRNHKQMLAERNGEEYVFQKKRKMVEQKQSVAEFRSSDDAFGYFPLDMAPDETQALPDRAYPINFEESDLEVSHSNDLLNNYFGNTTIDFKKYKQQILSQYEMPPGFAGYYSIITWGCGSGCLSGAMVDVRDGTIYALPSANGIKNEGEIVAPELLTDIASNVEYRADSTLLLTSFFHPQYIPNTKKHGLDTHYWVWNEEGKEFVPYQSTYKEVSD